MEETLQKTVLITGAGGLIGSLLVGALSNSYTLRALALEPIAGVDTVVTDITDMEALVAAFQGVDSVIHLAANGHMHAAWDTVLHNNIIGTYTVFEAAARTGVQQVILASTNHVVGSYDLEAAPAIYQTGKPVLDHLVPVRPDSLYGVSKSFGESLGRYYVDQRGLRVICLRIGFIWREDTPVGQFAESAERLAALWISRRDMVQLVGKCLLADQVQFDIFYGISNNTPRFYDLEHARTVIGYEPQDRAEDFSA
jgi:nucleoside-diphosphate-sugar epimerase